MPKFSSSFSHFMKLAVWAIYNFLLIIKLLGIKYLHSSLLSFLLSIKMECVSPVQFDKN